jgi:hypothetical protein
MIAIAQIGNLGHLDRVGPQHMINELVSVAGAAPQGPLLGKLIDTQRLATPSG